MNRGYKIFFLFICLWSHLSAQDIIGTWQGRISFWGEDMRLVFHFKKDSAGHLTGTMDNSTWGIKNAEMDELELNGDSLKFEFYEHGSKYSGVYNKDSAAFIGGFRMEMSRLPMNLVKGEANDLLYNRPQKPKKPYPYLEEEIAIVNKKSGDTLAGTLTKPNVKGKFPAAILISGSGPEDRDETVFGHKPFLIISDYLTRRGFAVLRCDDRGTGKSTGKFKSATIDDFVTDVEAQFEFLKSRNDIDLKRIGLIGHSEGGVVAPLVASKHDDISFVVLLAAPGINFFDLLLIQDSLVYVSEGKSPERTRRFVDKNSHLFEILRTTNDSATAADSMISYLVSIKTRENEITTTLKELGKESMRWYIHYHPEIALSKLKCPVLALNGEKDVQVPAKESLDGIKAALNKGGNKNHTELVIPGCNHLFQKCIKCSVSEYVKIDQTMDESALNAIREWMSKNVSHR